MSVLFNETRANLPRLREAIATLPSVDDMHELQTLLIGRLACYVNEIDFQEALTAAVDSQREYAAARARKSA